MLYVFVNLCNFVSFIKLSCVKELAEIHEISEMSSNVSFALNLQSEAGQKAIIARLESELRVLENLKVRLPQSPCAIYKSDYDPDERLYIVF